MKMTAVSGNLYFCYNRERLFAGNGLRLTPTGDHLFDRGFISFENDGEWLISPVAHAESMNKMGISTRARRQRLLRIGWGDSNRLGNGERSSAEPKAREGRAERERTSPRGRLRGRRSAPDEGQTATGISRIPPRPDFLKTANP